MGFKFIRWFPGIALCALLCACSEMKIVNPANPQKANEEAERVVMTGVVADLTTSGMLQRRIRAARGVYLEGAGLLDVEDVSVDSFSADGRKAGITRASTGRSYFSGFEDKTTQPAIVRSKGDVEFLGRVQHVVPDKTDVTRNAVTLETSQIWWNELQQQYFCNTPYEMLIAGKAKKPLVLRGNGFHASSDMSKWLVKNGSITTEKDKDPTADREKIMRDLAGVARMAHEAEEKNRLERESKSSRSMDFSETSAPVSSSQVSVSESQNGTTTGGRKVARIPASSATADLPQVSAKQEITSSGRKIAKIPTPGSQSGRKSPNASSEGASR